LIDAVIYKISYSVRDNQLIVRLMGRDTHGNRVDRYVNGIRPYFYVPVEEALGPKGGKTMSEVIGLESGPPSTDGREMTRIYTRYPFDIATVKERFTFHCEADIIFANRVRIDHHLSYVRLPEGDDVVHISRIQPLDTAPSVTPRICYVDIETDDANGYAEPSNPTNQITAVSIYDSGKNAYACIYTGHEIDLDLVMAKVPKPLLGTLRLFPVKNEHDLIGALGLLLKKAAPDIVAAWNGQDYDFPYLAGRAKQLWAREPENDDIGLVYNSFHEELRRTHGSFVVVDPMRIYMKQELAQRAHSLQAVAMDILGYGKLQRESSVSELRRKDFAKFIAYNVFDSHLMRMLDLHPDGSLIPYFIGIAMVNGVELDDCYFNSRVVDGALLIEARRSGYPTICLPSKQFAPRRIQKGRAAQVFPTTPGMFSNIVALDLKTEYPAVMMTLNMSPETRRLHAIPGETFDLPTGGHYLKNQDGLVKRCLLKFREVRDAAKAEAKKHPMGSAERDKAETISKAIKFVVNSFAGVFDDPYWRLANVETFEDITGISRLQLNWNKNHLEDSKWLTDVLGYPARGKVIMGDTDSCYLEVSRLRGTPPDVQYTPLGTNDEAVLAANLIRDALNATYEEFMAQFGPGATNYTEVDIEGVFGKIRTLPLGGSDIGAKKRYVGLYDYYGGKDVRDLPFEARKKISGIEVKRFNVAPITKEIQLGVIERYLTGRSKEIRPFVENIKKQVYAGLRDDDLLIPAKMSDSDKDLQWNRAIRNGSEALGIPARPGDPWRWAFVSSVRKESERGYREFAIPFLSTLKEIEEDGWRVTPNRELMYNKTVRDPLSLVYPEWAGTTASLEERY
jgi:DNA polymerase, archaea type